MMTKMPSSKTAMWRYLLAVPILLLLILSFTHKEVIEPTAIDVQQIAKDTIPDEKIFRIVVQMPRFPGCEDMEGSEHEKKTCADKNMLEFIDQNIQYPAIAKDNGVEGTVIVQVVIDKNGMIKTPIVVRDIGADCGKEALRVVNLMNEKNLRWTPGKQKGQTVNVQYNLPVKFSLGVKKEASPFSSEEEIFTVVDQEPRFPGCEDMEGSDKEKKNCADKKMLGFIYKNIRYPAIARDKGVEGTVVVQFVIDKNGRIQNAKIAHDIGADCGEEALRAVNSMNEESGLWTPGRQGGEAGNVKINLPVMFRHNGN